MIPWCYPVSKIVFLSIGLKVFLVGCIVIDNSGKYVLIEVIALFIVQLVIGFYRVLFSPNYIREVDFIVKSKEFLLLLVFFIGMICGAVKDTINYDLMYFVIFTPGITIGWKLFENYRNQ